MKYTLAAQNVVLTDASRKIIEEKVGRLEKYLRHPWPVEIAFRPEGKGQIMCSITYGEGKQTMHAERSNHSLETALDQCLEALKREIIKQHEKQRVQG